MVTPVRPPNTWIENSEGSQNPAVHIENSIIMSTPGGTGISVNNSTDQNNRGTPSGVVYGDSDNREYVHGRIRQMKKKRGAKYHSTRLRLLGPEVLYRFVKARFRPLERRRLTSKLRRIGQLVGNLENLGQIALRDKIEDKFGKLLREQEMLACGYDKAMPRSVLDAFVVADKKRAIKFTFLKNYTRPLPAKVKKHIKKVQDKKLFDGLIVMHTDPDDKAIEKTREEKRDPILFGVIQQSPLYYFITDWVDEFCDLTMDKIIDLLKLDTDEVEIENDVEKSVVKHLLEKDGDPNGA